MLEKSVVLYLPDDGGKKKCGRCMMYLKDVGKCSIHGKGIDIKENMVCGLYLNGKPMTSEDHPPMKFITPEQSGLIMTEDGTHCLSCENANKNATRCKAVKGVIEPNGCCNGWVGESMDYDYQIAREKLGKTIRAY